MRSIYWKTGEKNCHFEGGRTKQSLLLCLVLQAIYETIALIRNISSFSFSVSFCENQWLLELVSGLGDMVMSLIP